MLFRWIYNDFPNFIIPDQRRFVSQTTGNMYIAKVEASDVGNYSCFVSSPTIGKSVFSMPISLIPQIESERCKITHNTTIFAHNCLTETTVFFKGQLMTYLFISALCTEEVKRYPADIRVKFPKTYALVHQNITLECFALGK